MDHSLNYHQTSSAIVTPKQLSKQLLKRDEEIVHKLVKILKAEQELDGSRSRGGMPMLNAEDLADVIVTVQVVEWLAGIRAPCRLRRRTVRDDAEPWPAGRASRILPLSRQTTSEVAPSVTTGWPFGWSASTMRCSARWPAISFGLLSLMQLWPACGRD